MMFYIKLGTRNLLLNYRRSVKTILTIVIGLSACLLAQGFMSHTMWGLRESLINGGLGHIQLFRKGYLEHNAEEPYKYMITDCKAVFSKLSVIKGIKLFTPRLNFQGIAATGEKSAIILGIAGIPSNEKDLNTFSTLKEGVFLEESKPYGVMIGSGVARKLNVRAGDSVTIMSTMAGGGVNAVDVNISGIMGAQIKAYDDVLLLADLNTIQDLLNLPGSVDRIIILLNKTEDLGSVEPYIRSLCAEMGLEYRNWRELAGMQYAQPKLFYDLVFMLMMMIIVLVVIFSITNTLNLAMQERVREIGTIRSLGTTRFQVGKIFISESILLGLFGGFCGIVLGYLLAFVLNALGGIPIPPPPGQARGYIALFKPDFRSALLLWLLFIITAAAAGFYPALRASRLQIVDALRWV